MRIKRMTTDYCLQKVKHFPLVRTIIKVYIFFRNKHFLLVFFHYNLSLFLDEMIIKMNVGNAYYKELFFMKIIMQRNKF